MCSIFIVECQSIGVVIEVRSKIFPVIILSRDDIRFKFTYVVKSASLCFYSFIYRLRADRKSTTRTPSRMSQWPSASVRSPALQGFKSLLAKLLCPELFIR